MELEGLCKRNFLIKTAPFVPFPFAADQTPESPALVKAQCTVVSRFCHLRNNDGVYVGVRCSGGATCLAVGKTRLAEISASGAQLYLGRSPWTSRPGWGVLNLGCSRMGRPPGEHSYIVIK